MQSRADVSLAAQLVHRGIVARSAVEACLAKLGENGAPPGTSLMALLIERGDVTREAVDALRLELAVAEGELPDLFPGYRMLHKLGEGGMSWVFAARREATGETVALKILRPAAAENPRTRAQFIREAKLLKSLRHESIVHAFEVGKIRGFYFFSMEAIEGESLLDKIDAGETFDEEKALRIVLQIARALEYLRENGIVHRDIKPGNLLVTREGGVKLCDLGLASVTASPGEADASETTVGTVEYVSPEQARGRSDLDVRSDIYSLGVTLYHLLLGHLPFEGSDNREVMAKQILESLSSPEMKSRLSPHMHYFIEKMMAKEREFRYQDPMELVRDIESQVEGRETLHYRPVEEPTRPAARPGLRPRRRTDAGRRKPRSRRSRRR